MVVSTADFGVMKNSVRSKSLLDRPCFYVTTSILISSKNRRGRRADEASTGEQRIMLNRLEDRDKQIGTYAARFAAVIGE